MIRRGSDRSLRPNVDDVFFQGAFFNLPEFVLLSDGDKWRLVELIKFVAFKMVWTYSAPSEAPYGVKDQWVRDIVRLPSIEDAEAFLQRVGCFVERRSGKVFLCEDYSPILIGSYAPPRDPIGSDVRRQVFDRDGNRCFYCGSVDGPFHLDHVVPVIRGGSNAAENLVVACVPCNLSKGSKTLEEWIG